MLLKYKYEPPWRHTPLCALLHEQLFDSELQVWFSFGWSASLSITAMLPEISFHFFHLGPEFLKLFEYGKTTVDLVV